MFKRILLFLLLLASTSAAAQSSSGASQGAFYYGSKRVGGYDWTGAWAIGPGGTLNSTTGRPLTVNGAIVAGGTGTGDESKLMFLGSNIYSSLFGGLPRTGSLGGGGMYFDSRTTDTNPAIGFIVNRSADSTTTTATDIGNIQANGAWTIGTSGTLAANRVQASVADYTLKIENLAGVSSSNNGLNVKVNTTGAANAFSVSNASTIMFNVNGSGDTLIANSAAKPFQITGSNGNLRSQYVRDNTTATAANMVVDSNGDFFKSTSSRRYKENIRYSVVDPTLTYRLRPVTFDAKRDHTRHIGLIAEDVEKVDPRLVTYQDGLPESVEYAMVTAPLIATAQAQHAEIIELKAYVKTMRAEIAELKEAIGQ